MTRRLLRVMVEIEGVAFDPDDANPYADSQIELESVLKSNLQTITSMDAGDVITLRDSNGNRCGKVEMEDFPGVEPLLPYWARLSDLALEVEDEFPVQAFIRGVVEQGDKEMRGKSDRFSADPGVQKSDDPEPKASYNESVDEEAARAFDEGKVADSYPGTPSSHEHIAERDPEGPVAPKRPRRGSTVTRESNSVPLPPGDPSLS